MRSTFISDGENFLIGTAFYPIKKNGIKQALATADAGNATVQEAKTDWNLS